MKKEPLVQLKKSNDKDIESYPVAIIKKPDDGITTRVSAGGDKKNGFYLTYRGNLNDVRAVIEFLNKILTLSNEQIEKIQK